MVNDIAIYGAGGLGREMAILLSQINQKNEQWNLIGFYDDFKSAQTVDNLPVLGGIEELNSITKSLSLLVAIADGKVRSKIISKITNIRIKYPVIIHPGAIVGSKSNVFGNGTVITAGCILTTGISFGDFVILNLAVTVGHDVKVGNYSSIMPATNISGNVTIGENVLIGTGTQILQGLTIGKSSIIGAGAVVTKDIPESVIAYGVPAKIISTC
jgi:sugar O-acyltransferase (sialic acid O-acetyltransferase NeuD family)